MPGEFKAECARPTGGPAGESPQPVDSTTKETKETSQMILIGRRAPAFTVPAYLQGKFVNVTLSEYQGKWVLLCFYPGDFTFV